MVNPIVPAGYYAAWALVAAVVITFMILAVVSVIRRRADLSGTTFIVWLLVILALPGVGAAAWFLLGRSQVRTSRIG